MAEQYKEDTHEIKDPVKKVTAKTPLTPTEQRFLTEYIRTGKMAASVRKAGYVASSDAAYAAIGRNLLNKPNLKAEVNRVMEELHKETVASANEVMEYFTKVMRGELNDQFGLDAPLAERTRAAQELAKRTIDVENRAKGNADANVAITLNWNRDEEDD